MKNKVSLFPEGKSKYFTMSFDDGVVQDRQLIRLMNAYGIRGAFHISTGLFGVCAAENSPVYPYQRRCTQEEAAVLYPDSGQEIALHGYKHLRVAQLSAPEIEYELRNDLKQHEAIFHRQPRGYSYPGGSVSEAAVRVLRALGIVYARTAESSYSFDLPVDPLKWACTCHYADPQMPELLRQFLNSYPDDVPQLFSVWGHSYECEMYGNWDLMEFLLRSVGRRDDIQYITPLELFGRLSESE